MAALSAAESIGNTMSGTTADTLKITNGWPWVEIVNYAGVDNIWVTRDGSTPAANGSGSILVRPGEVVVVSNPQTFVSPDGVLTLKATGSGGNSWVARGIGQP